LTPPTRRGLRALAGQKRGRKVVFLNRLLKNDGILSRIFEMGMSFFPFLFLSFWINMDKVKTVEI
jgi:hypothetical protein